MNKKFSQWLTTRDISATAVGEAVLWMAVPYTLLGGVYVVFHQDVLHALQDYLLTRLPAGADVAPYVLLMLTWPLWLVWSSIT